MDGGQLLGWRVRGALTTVATYASQAADHDLWLHRSHPGANVLGFTLWHAATIVDWTVHTLIQGRDELRSQEPWVEAGIGVPIIPFGMPIGTADEIAEGVDPMALVEYAGVLGDAADGWLAELDAAALRAAPDTQQNLDAAGLEQLPGFVEESSWMHGAKVYELVGRPCVGHVFFHGGEAAAVIDQALARRGS